MLFIRLGPQAAASCPPGKEAQDGDAGDEPGEEEGEPEEKKEEPVEEAEATEGFNTNGISSFGFRCRCH